MTTKISLFQGKKVRKTTYKDEWWFVIEDVVAILTDSSDPKQYIQRMKQRDTELGQGWVQIVHTLDVATEGGKQRMNCANTEGCFRLIQSIPSPKAEPFKRWLAKVGYERVQEIEDPELATKRTRSLYKAKGYPEDWIEKRMRGIAVRGQLTDEWSKRAVKEGREYAILTAEISKATFGMTPAEYKKKKGLERENLRDHPPSPSAFYCIKGRLRWAGMNDLELIFTMLGEASTTEIAKSKDARGFEENKDAAQKGGTIAGGARKALELESGKNVVSKENYLDGADDQLLV